jgi:hypothetical protein
MDLPPSITRGARDDPGVPLGRSPMDRAKGGPKRNPETCRVGGGSSPLPFGAGADRLNHLETLRLRPEGGSSKAGAKQDNAGAFSTAQASEIHDAGTALFSAVVSFGSFVTSLGCV